MPLTSELLPAPLTPVTHAKTPSGSFTSTSFRLCSFAPSTSMNPLGVRRALGTSMRLRPERKAPVMLLGFASISAGVPWAVTLPPRCPAPGPKSTT